MALKIVNNNAGCVGHEHKIKEHSSVTDLLHCGWLVIRILLDFFEVKGPEGLYPCLVYLPMRELLLMY